MPFLVAVVLASLGVAGIGYTSQTEPDAQPQSAVAFQNDAILGSWSGEIEPPDEAPPGLEFSWAMELEDDGGSIVGTFTVNISFNGEEQSVEMEVADGEFDPSSGEFTCEIIPPEEAGGETGTMTASVDGDDIEGTLEGGGEETVFSGSRD
ncbi:MAG: hypothetical protein ACYTF7_10130 [Planctomycetota bacterium]|jgi:hypothetical protein